MPDSPSQPHRTVPLRFVETPVTDAAAHALLTAYFSERALSFPAQQGHYRAALPSAEQFLPPAGVFLLLDDPADDGFAGCGGIRRLDAGTPNTVRYEIKHLWLQPITQALQRALRAGESRIWSMRRPLFRRKPSWR